MCAKTVQNLGSHVGIVSEEAVLVADLHKDEHVGMLGFDGHIPAKK